MSSSRSLTRQRLIHAALELFAAQGVTETTTRQIAEQADVNEVTLFRHFGSKHGLLLAVIEEAAVFTRLGQTLVQQANQANSLDQALHDYATACLEALERVPEMLRSVVGEAGQYPSENRAALGRGFTQANHYVAEYFKAVIDRGQIQPHLEPEKLASLLNGMLLGYAIIEFTSEFHELWQNRDDFLDNLVTLFLHGAVSPESPALSNSLLIPAMLPDTNVVHDLSADTVHDLMLRAKKQGLQIYAIVYVLLGAGLSPLEMAQMERAHYISDRDRHIMRVTQGATRQVPINQWIMGKRYGTYLKNPLTQWLKSRKDQHPALFINAGQEPMTPADIQVVWQEVAESITAPDGRSPTIEQAQQTWCVEQFMRGMTLEDMQILTGWSISHLKPYMQRARQKTALEHAMQLDQK